jgi:hypothetical protein
VGGFRIGLLRFLGERMTSRAESGREKQEKTRRGRALDGKNLDAQRERKCR